MKPLPLIDGSLFIDNSSLETLQTCPRAFEYSKIEKRVINKPAPALSFGSAIHNALELRYKTYQNRTPDVALFEAQSAALQAYFAANPTEDDEPRNLNWAIELIKKYNEVYHTEPFNVLVDKDKNTLCELSFAIPLYTHHTLRIPVIYTGRIDLPVMWDNGIWIIDHKTASRLGQQYFDEKQMSAQQIGYCWAYEQLTGQPCAGFCINALRTTTIPARPKSVQEWWAETLQRQRYHVTREQIIEWKRNVIALVEEAFYHHTNSFFPQKTVWCCGKYGKCQYFGVCSYPVDKRAIILSSTEYADNIWSPLKTKETT